MGCIVMSEEFYDGINLEIKSLLEELKFQKKINAKQADIINEKNSVIKDCSKLQEENEKLKSENNDLKKSIDILRRDSQDAVKAAVSDSYYENKELKRQIKDLNVRIHSLEETIKRYLEAYYVEKAKYEACEKAFRSTIDQLCRKTC